MNPVKLRINGVWVDSTISAKLRSNGTWVEYSPELENPTYEALAWPNPVPSLTDAVDGGSIYNLGIRFHILEAKWCYGIQWRVPDNVPNPPGGHVASLWNRLTEKIITTKAFTPVAGQYQDILFDEPVELTIFPQEYTVSVFTSHYVYRAPDSNPWTVQSPSGNVVADIAQLSDSGDPAVYPASTFNALYYVSPLIEV